MATTFKDYIRETWNNRLYELIYSDSRDVIFDSISNAEAFAEALDHYNLINDDFIFYYFSGEKEESGYVFKFESDEELAKAHALLKDLIKSNNISLSIEKIRPIKL